MIYLLVALSYVTVVFFPASIFAWYVTHVTAGLITLPVLSFVSGVYVTSAVVALPFMKSTTSPLRTFETGAPLPLAFQWWLDTASATAYNCEPLIASVEVAEIRPAATLVI